MRKQLLYAALLLVLCVSVGNPLTEHAEEEKEGEELQCGIRTCFMKLLHFKDFHFSSLMKKIHVAAFCIRECSPPVVHEFIQSVTYAITKRIPGQCSGKKCAEVNRFVALGDCLRNRSWPLVQCATRLVDLAQLSLEPVGPELHGNKTCGVIIGAIHCFESNIEKCGPLPYNLVQETLSKAFQAGINFLCHVKYERDGSVQIITEPTTEFVPSTTPRIPSLLPPVAKGFADPQPNSASTFGITILCGLATILAVYMTLRHR